MLRFAVYTIALLVALSPVKFASSAKVVPEEAGVELGVYEVMPAKTIAIIDDQFVNRSILSRQIEFVLRKIGHEFKVFQFESGGAFIERHRELSVDILIVDGVMMSGLQGPDVIAHMVSVGFKGKMVAWTTCLDTQAAMLEAGAHHVLEKPSGVKSLTSLLSSLLFTKTVSVDVARERFEKDESKDCA